MRIIYIDVDSLRADHLGCYGYPRPTSPNIDAIAREGIVARNAYVSSSPCMPSRATLLTGRFAIEHGVLTHWGPGSEFRLAGEDHGYPVHSPFITRLLREHGYTTVSFSSFLDRHLAFWFSAGWSELHTHTLKRGNENADEVAAAYLPWIRDNIQHVDDLFLHLQFWDPHRNYTVPDPAAIEAVASAPGPDWITGDVIAAQQSDVHPYSATQLFPGLEPGASPVPAMPGQISSRQDAEQFVNGYDGAIRYLDDRLGELFDALDHAGVLDDTAIIISGDHGEALGETGVWGDHCSTAEAVHHVPLIIRWPGLLSREIDGLHYQADVLPTILDLLDIPIPVGWNAASFAPELRESPDAASRPYLVWDHGLYAAQRALRTPRWLYQETYHPGLFPHAPISLFAIDEDPHQQHDVAEDHPEIVEDLHERMSEWRQQHLEVTHAPDPLDLIVDGGGPYRYIGRRQWADRLSSQGLVMPSACGSEPTG